MTGAMPPSSPVETVARRLDVTAKALLLMMLASALSDPDMGNMKDKAAWWRAVGYPLLAFTVPVLWAVCWRDRMTFPWLVDLCITVPCFSDILGNRLDLYDTIWWFDDWMHFINLVLLTAAVVMLTLHRSATRLVVLERSLAFGVTSALAWEIAEYYAFLHRWASLPVGLYEDTLGDLALGVLGAAVGGLVVHRLWQSGRLRHVEPVVRAEPATA